MTLIPEDRDRVRRHLLGQLDDRQREELDQKLLTDEEMFEELLIAEDELVDEYLTQRLSPDEVAKFEQHFLSTTERHEKLKFGRALNQYLSGRTNDATATSPALARLSWGWPHVFFSPLRLAALALVVVGLAFGIWRVFFYQSDVDKGLLALNAAYREQRPVESRISALTYAPFSQTRGPETDRVNKSDLQRSELTLLEALELNPNLLEALFNRALCRQNLMLPQQAAEDWGEYLKRDSTSSWAEEARRNLQRLQEQKDKKSQTKEQLLKDFLSAHETRNDDAAWAALSRSRGRTGNLVVEALLDEYLFLSASGNLKQAEARIGLISYAG